MLSQTSRDFTLKPVMPDKSDVEGDGRSQPRPLLAEHHATASCQLTPDIHGRYRLVYKHVNALYLVKKIKDRITNDFNVHHLHSNPAGAHIFLEARYK